MTEPNALPPDIAALKRDAERYRWLRKFHPSKIIVVVETNAAVGDLELHEDELDDALDEAMKERVK